MKFGFFIFSSRANCCSDFTRQQATHSLIQIVLWYSVRFAGGFCRPLSTPALVAAAGTASATHAANTRSEDRDIRRPQYAAVAKHALDGQREPAVHDEHVAADHLRVGRAEEGHRG